MLMNSSLSQVDYFDLAVDSPSAAGAASPDVAPQPVQQGSAQPDHEPHAEHHMAPGSDSRASAYTAHWVQATAVTAAEAGDGLGSELTDSSAAAPEAAQAADAAGSAAAAAAQSVVEVNDEPQDAASGQHAELAAGEASLQGGMPAESGIDQAEHRRLTLTAPEEEEAADEDAEGEDSISIPLGRVPRRSSLAGRASHKGMSLATWHGGHCSISTIHHTLYPTFPATLALAIPPSRSLDMMLDAGRPGLESHSFPDTRPHILCPISPVQQTFLVSRKSSMVFGAGRLSLAHARKSLAGTQLLPMERRARLESLPIHPAQGR